jgi:hypothetical protein
MKQMPFAQTTQPGSILSDWRNIATIISTVVAVASFFYALIVRRGQKREDIRKLDIRVNPTRDQSQRQLAQFMVHNRGKRPVNLEGWMVSYCDGKCNYSMVIEPTPDQQKHFPLVLHEQDDFVFMVHIADELGPLEKIADFAIRAKDGEVFRAPKDVVKLFIKTATDVRDRRPPWGTNTKQL